MNLNQPGGEAAVTTWARLGRVHVRRASATGYVLPVNVQIYWLPNASTAWQHTRRRTGFLLDPV